MKKTALISLLAVVALLFAVGIGVAADQITIMGQVNEDSQLVDDQGNVYDIADTDEGMKVKEMVGEKVEVRGTLMDQEGAKEITVESFSVTN
jgi:hypothetical protein